MFGVDLGLSSLKAVQVEKGKIKKKKRIFLNEKQSIEKQIEKFLSDSFFSKAKTIALTGAYSSKVKELKGKKLIQVNEIQAIGKGSAFFSKEKNFLAVSAGTGSCFVSVKGKKFAHIGGTAIGGKTILGLGELILKEKEFKKIELLAEKGNSKKVDLMLFDVYEKGIGLLKENVPIAHFGNLSSRKKEDLSAGIFNLVCQGISIPALFAERTLKHNKIVFSGSLSESKLFKKQFCECINLFSKKTQPVFLKEAGFVSAIGAALIN